MRKDCMLVFGYQAPINEVSTEPSVIDKLSECCENFTHNSVRLMINDNICYAGIMYYTNDDIDIDCIRNELNNINKNALRDNLNKMYNFCGSEYQISDAIPADVYLIEMD